MGFYQHQVVPLLTDLSMRNKHLAAYRDRVVPAATGRVLEIGIGSGLNLGRYSPNVSGWNLHPSCWAWRETPNVEAFRSI